MGFEHLTPLSCCSVAFTWTLLALHRLLGPLIQIRGSGTTSCKPIVYTGLVVCRQIHCSCGSGGCHCVRMSVNRHIWLPGCLSILSFSELSAVIYPFQSITFSSVRQVALYRGVARQLSSWDSHVTPGAALASNSHSNMISLHVERGYFCTLAPHLSYTTVTLLQFSVHFPWGLVRSCKRKPKGKE